LGLKALGSVVAVTGDGTNDAPALSKSDVGFAMIDGTDISKDASDIVILDNNFSSIVIAIIYGRSIYENIRKFLQFQLTVNFCACFLVFICSCIGNETPLTSIQMLWVNLIMDSLGSLALATEPPYDALLNRYPTKRNESIINGTMWKHILIQSLFELILLVFIYIYGPSFIKEDKIVILNSHYELFSCFGILPGDVDYLDKYDNILDGREIAWSKTNFIDLNKIDQEKFGCRKFLSNDQSEWESFSLYDSFEYYNFEYGSTTHMTLIFNIFVFYTLLNQFNCRIINDSINIFSRINKGLMFCLVTFCEMSIQVLIVQFGYSVFHCVYGGLSIKQWQLCLIFSSTTFIVNFVTKFLPFEKMIDMYLAKKEKEENGNKLAPIQIEMEMGIEDNQSTQQGDENLINNIK
jgi:Ca2+ transporting ATPase